MVGDFMNAVRQVIMMKPGLLESGILLCETSPEGTE